LNGVNLNQTLNMDKTMLSTESLRANSKAILNDAGFRAFRRIHQSEYK
jgi:hypothetical protein